jgi:hypothetical protein
LDFGCQLAEKGRIIDLAAANGIFDCAKQIWELLQIQAGLLAAQVGSYPIESIESS